ncbi:hypothetical protein BS78_07G110400 [Paspalum vaginatum]|nr:hypothetical protein BS78_07G110400 [Paspalum vaginatum]
MTGFDLPANFHNNPESLLRSRVRQKTIHGTKEPTPTMAVPEKAIREFSVPSSNNIPTGLEVAVGEGFELKPSFIHMVQAILFCGLAEHCGNTDHTGNSCPGNGLVDVNFINNNSFNNGPRTSSGCSQQFNKNPFNQKAVNDSISKKFHVNDRILESLSLQMETLNSAMKNQLSFNKMLETQIAQLAAALPIPTSGKLPGQPEAPRKEHINAKKGLGNPTISCSIGTQHFDQALCDLGARVSVMPKVVFDKLTHATVAPTAMCLQLADQSILYPGGIAEDIPVKIRNFIVPVDFVVLDMEIDSKTQLILGRQFLSTAEATIDVGARQVHLNINGRRETFAFKPKVEQCRQVPTYAKYLKDILNNKKPLPVEVMHLMEECSAAILNQPPHEKKDPGNPTVSCSIRTQHFDQALCDLGASVSITPKVVFDKITHATLALTAMCLQLADQSIRYSIKIAEDIPIKIWNFLISVDFVVLDMEIDSKTPLILPSH